jgi:hypothetical protein
VKRHLKRISSVNLRPLDRARVSAESVTAFKRFYVLVLYYYAILLTLY